MIRQAPAPTRSPPEKVLIQYVARKCVAQSTSHAHSTIFKAPKPWARLITSLTANTILPIDEFQVQIRFSPRRGQRLRIQLLHAESRLAWPHKAPKHPQPPNASHRTNSTGKECSWKRRRKEQRRRKWNEAPTRAGDAAAAAATAALAMLTP